MLIRKPPRGLPNRVGLWSLCLAVMLGFFSSGLQAAIQFRAATKDVSETVPLTASKPTGTTVGDLLIAFVMHDSDPACPCSPPAGQGWTAFSLAGAVVQKHCPVAAAQLCARAQKASPPPYLLLKAAKRPCGHTGIGEM